MTLKTEDFSHWWNEVTKSACISSQMSRSLAGVFSVELELIVRNTRLHGRQRGVKMSPMNPGWDVVRMNAFWQAWHSGLMYDSCHLQTAQSTVHHYYHHHHHHTVFLLIFCFSLHSKLSCCQALCIPIVLQSIARRQLWICYSLNVGILQSHKQIQHWLS